MQKTVNRLLRRLQKSETRIKRDGLPNGFFLNDLLWFGDAASGQTAVAKGFLIVPGERDSLDDASQEDLVDRLRVLLATLGDQYTVQVKLLICSDFSTELEGYRLDTEAISDRYRFRWQIYNRTERHARYLKAMEEGKLRRDILVIYFSRIIDSEPRFSVSESALEDHFSRLATREELGFREVQGNALNTIFPDCLVTPMGDREHFAHYYRFLNPHLGASIPPVIYEAFDPGSSIQMNCMNGDVVQPPTPGVSFQMDGLNHVIFGMRELPRRMGPGLISRLTNLGHQDVELTLNIYPQKSDVVIRDYEKVANQLAGEVRTQPKHTHSLGVQLDMAKERIQSLERGTVQPFRVFCALRLWHRDVDTLISRSSVAQGAFLAMSGAKSHWCSNAETARQMWYQTWPGWMHGSYRGYDLETDDVTASELLPWSASFTGRLDTAEAIYDSASGGLVGITTQVGGVPQHILIFGMVGSGKSVWLADLLAQIGHNFSYVLIVEEGLSHGVSAQTLGASPVIIKSNGNVTINYLGVDGVPLSNEHIGAAVALCLQMLRESGNSDQSKLSVIQACLSQHINALYDASWAEWSVKNPEKAADIGRNAYQIETYRATMSGTDNSIIDAWAELRDTGADVSIDEHELAKFMTHHSTRSIVRDVGYSYMAPEDMPTHSQLVEMMTLTPIGGYDENPQAVEIGDRLSVWCASGPYGRLFDGVSTTALTADVIHFELGLIPDSLAELRAAAHFLVLNYARQSVVKRPRGERKLLIFEEGARIVALPGGAKLLSEMYGQMRKFGAVCCTVFQQIAALESAPPEVRAAVVDNSKLFIISGQPSPRAADAIGDALDLSDAPRQAIKRFALPEHQLEGQKFSSFLVVAPDPRRKLIGTMRNIASPEVVYAGSSDNDIFDSRQKVLKEYTDVVEGIITESKKYANT